MTVFQLATLGRITQQPGIIAGEARVPGHTLGGTYQACKAFVTKGYVKKDKQGGLHVTKSGTKEYERHMRQLVGVDRD